MARQYQQEGRSLVRQYAQIMGIVILLVGVVGLVLGDDQRLIVFNIDLVEDIVHLVTGGLMAYVGFAARDSGPARTVVGGLGVVYLLVGILGFIVPNLFGLLPHGYNLADNILHLVLGVLGIAVAGLGRSTARSDTVETVDASRRR